MFKGEGEIKLGRSSVVFLVNKAPQGHHELAGTEMQEVHPGITL